MRGFANGLASKVFRIQSMTQGGVPGDIVRSARLIKEGKGSNADLNKLRDYLGISQSGATQSRTQLQQIRSMGGKASQFAVLGSVASGGGVTGAVAGYQFAQNAATELEKAVKSGAMNKVIAAMIKKPDTISALGRSLSTSTAIAQLRKGGSSVFHPLALKGDKNFGVGFNVGMDPGAKAEAEASYLTEIAASKYALGRFARVARAGLGYAAAGVALTYGGLKLGDLLSGQTGGEAWRTAQSQAALTASDPFASTTDRRLGVLQLRRADRARSFGFLAGRRNAGDEEEMAFLRSTKAAEDSGVSGASLYQLSRERVYKDKYGFMLGTIVNGLTSRIRNLTGRNFADNDAIADQAEKSATRAAALRDEAHTLATRAEFGAAQSRFNEAAKELGTQACENPETIWKQSVVERGSIRLWPRLQMNRANMRTGD